jgi:carbon storage regulator CsrA
MLVLTRKSKQQIRVGENVVITILKVKGQSVRVGIEAPQHVRVVRAELPLFEDADDAAGSIEIAPGKTVSVGGSAEKCRVHHAIDGGRSSLPPTLRHGLSERVAARAKRPPAGGDDVIAGCLPQGVVFA